MRCTNCGAEISDNVKFCTNCGANLNIESAPIQQERNEPIYSVREKRRKWPVVVGALVLVVALASAGFFVTKALLSKDNSASEKTTEESAKTEKTEESKDAQDTKQADIEILKHDINYSKINNQRDGLKKMSFEKNPVDCLLYVRNNTDQPIRAINFELHSGGTAIDNRVTGKGTFTAYGYVKPGEEDIMYSPIYLSEADGAKHSQGKIVKETITSKGEIKDYAVPDGSPTAHNKAQDAYSVNVNNPNDSTLSKGSFIVMIKNDALASGIFAGSWGAGVLSKDVAKGKSAKQKNAIYNPGLEGKWYPEDYTVCVFDKNTLTAK